MALLPCADRVAPIASVMRSSFDTVTAGDLVSLNDSLVAVTVQVVVPDAGSASRAVCSA